MISMILSALVMVIVIFAYTYHRKKSQEEMYKKLTYTPEDETPYPRGFGEIIVDYQYALFDKFVKSTWPCNFLSWECKLERLTHSYEGNHLIVVRHTDGTYHEEVVRVSTDNGGDGDTSIGAIYKFEVLTNKQAPDTPNPPPKPAEPKPEIKPEPKPESEPDSKPKSPEGKTVFERAADWVESHKERLVREVDKENWYLIKVGTGENDVEEELKGDVYRILEELDLFQIQIDEKGIGLCPLPEY